MSQTYVRLNKKGFIFKDRECGFSIAKGEVKPLPAVLGSLTRMWLQAGGLELCEPPQASVHSNAPVDEEIIEEQPVTRSKADRVAELELFEIKTLRQMCIERGLKFSYRSNKTTLANKIVDAEYGS